MDSRFNLIFSCVTGSHLYGTATASSDKDIRGIFIPSEEFYLGFLEKVEQVEQHEPDLCYWEISKFFKLCLDSNPNIIELLFVPAQFVEVDSAAWLTILKHRDLFLSTKAQYTFTGYAVSQLHRIKQHREWLLNPPASQPKRSDFGLLDDRALVSRDQVNAYDELKDRPDFNENLLNPNFLELLQREKAYLNASRHWQQYQEWKKNRNPGRAELEAKFGFDTKHGSHLVRLLSEGEELLTTGYITFPRPDAKDLLDIRNGKYSYDEIITRVGEIDGYFNGIKDKFILPHNPDRKKADELCRELIKEQIWQR